jgi:hypothetical protein
MKSFKEVKAAFTTKGLTLSKYTPNKNLNRQRYYIAEGANTLAGFDTLKEVVAFYNELTKKEIAVKTLNTANDIRDYIKEAVYLSPYGNINGIKDRYKLMAAIKKARAIAEWNIDLRMNNKELMYYAAKFLGVDAIPA